MAQAKNGDRVKVQFSGKLEDGTVFASTEKNAPLEILLGKSNLLEGFENAVIGMSPGDCKTVKIPAEQAYGHYNDKMVVKVDREEFFKDMTPEIGQLLELNGCDELPVTITAFTDSTVTLDANHPLVGKNLIFDIKLLEILKY